MNVSDTNLRSFLRNEAERLALKYGQLAVPIGRIAYDHGVHVERCASVGRYKAFLSLPRHSDDWARVTLPLRENEAQARRPSPYERFCVAHELAHLFLFREFGIKPTDAVTYWKHEALCDDFARHTLVPSSTVSNVVSASNYLTFVRDLQHASQTPIMHVARRVTQQVPRLTFARVVSDENGSWKVSTTSLLHNREAGRKLKGLLAIRLDSLRRSGEQERLWSFDGAALNKSHLKSYSPQSEFQLHAKLEENNGVSMLICINEISSSKSNTRFE